ncbi:MAG: 16S rRNA (uracil(1498)-N(3))-methyltransferase [Pseudomonadota bacterium]
MAIHDFKSQRLYVEPDLASGKTFEATREQANYLLNVLRMADGSEILVFNGKDGEWLTQIQVSGRKKCDLKPVELIRHQPEPSKLVYCFAPLKQARLDYMIQKAVEMGAGMLQPVITQFTQVRSINEKRVFSNAVEAAEQCGIISLPEIRQPVALRDLPKQLGEETRLVFCDEEAGEQPMAANGKESGDNPIAVLIGPEGGFSQEEREMIRSWPKVMQLGLGPRILRADTAAVAALALVQTQFGDWYANKDR